MFKQLTMKLIITSISLFISQINAQSIDAKLGGNTDAVNFDVKDSDETILLRVQGDGKIGVGKMDPDSLLDVNGTIRTLGLMMPTGAFEGYVLTATAYGDAFWESLDSIFVDYGFDTTKIDSKIDVLEIALWDSNGTHIYNDNEGFVGIGTSNPNEILTVEGVISLDEQTASPVHTSGYGKIYSKDDGKLYFKNSSGEETNVSAGTNIDITNIEAPHWDSTATGSHIFNENTGNVGIGTETPTQKLDVNGNIKTSYELHSSYGGSGNMMPLAYGWIDGDAWIELPFSVGDWTVERTSLGQYTVTINSPTGDKRLSPFVTPYSLSPRIANVYAISPDGSFQIKIYDIVGNFVDCAFSFIAYSP
ncbi:hypothetical protein ACFL3L_01110 [Candidatus Neomarinimicrobiota bacterium]